MKFLWFHRLLRTQAYQRYMRMQREAAEAVQQRMQADPYPWDIQPQWRNSSD